MGSLIYVAHSQQQWHVYRRLEDYIQLGRALGDHHIPPCPGLVADLSTTEGLTEQQRALQHWLITVLTNPQARSCKVTEDFLLAEYNQVPPDFHSYNWVQFSVDPQQPPAPQQNQDNSSADDVDTMDMEDMYVDNNDYAGNAGAAVQDEDVDLDAPPVGRYQPIDEQIADEDEAEFNRLAGEVERVDDIGSLAQSLGASYLGRSLQLQAEVGPPRPDPQNRPQQGLNVGAAVGRPPTGGGLAQMVADADVQGVSRESRASVPKGLNAFSLIRVIGKGSFGTYLHWSYIP